MYVVIWITRNSRTNHRICHFPYHFCQFRPCCTLGNDNNLQGDRQDRCRRLPVTVRLHHYLPNSIICLVPIFVFCICNVKFTSPSMVICMLILFVNHRQSSSINPAHSSRARNLSSACLLYIWLGPTSPLNNLC